MKILKKEGLPYKVKHDYENNQTGYIFLASVYLSVMFPFLINEFLSIEMSFMFRATLTLVLIIISIPLILLAEKRLGFEWKEKSLNDHEIALISTQLRELNLSKELRGKLSKVAKNSDIEALLPEVNNELLVNVKQLIANPVKSK